MTFAFIREGDSTSHGGTVQTGTVPFLVDGKKIALVGTMVSCPKCGGVFPIVTSKNPGMNFFGKQAAFEGDETACGATLIPSQTQASANVPTGTGGVGSKAVTADHEVDGASSLYRGRFQALNQQTGEPVAGHAYTLKTTDGQTLTGKTDGQGYTQWHEAENPASLIFDRGGDDA